jgi:hypothetical protein
MKRSLPLILLAAAACDHGSQDSPNDPTRGICNDIYDHTDECLVDLGCEGIADRATYVDQCLTEDYTASERDQFVATSCDAVNAAACTSDTTFYRDSCDCTQYTSCPEGLTCTDVGGGQAACFDSTGGPPDGGIACDSSRACDAGWGCALTAQDASTGVCVKLCAL